MEIVEDARSGFSDQHDNLFEEGCNLGQQFGTVAGVIDDGHGIGPCATARIEDNSHTQNGSTYRRRDRDGSVGVGNVERHGRPGNPPHETAASPVLSKYATSNRAYRRGERRVGTRKFVAATTLPSARETATPLSTASLKPSTFSTSLHPGVWVVVYGWRSMQISWGWPPCGPTAAGRLDTDSASAPRRVGGSARPRQESAGPSDRQATASRQVHCGVPLDLQSHPLGLRLVICRRLRDRHLTSSVGSASRFASVTSRPY